MSEELKTKKILEESEAEMIKVNDEYLIAIDPYNYVARRKGVLKALGYFGNMQNALSCIYDDMVKRKLKKDVRDIPSAIETISKVTAGFKQTLADKFPEYEVTKK